MTTRKERETRKLLHWLNLPRDKRHRIRTRYEKLVFDNFLENGPGPEKSYAERTKDKEIQIAVQEENRQFHEEYPTFG